MTNKVIYITHRQNKIHSVPCHSLLTSKTKDNGKISWEKNNTKEKIG